MKNIDIISQTGVLPSTRRLSVFSMLPYDTKRRIMAWALFCTEIGSLPFISGCTAPDKYQNRMDVIDINDSSQLKDGISHTLHIDGYGFDLNVMFYPQNGEWHLDEANSLAVIIHTTGLPNDTSVYIDNLHVDSYGYHNTTFNDSLEDTADDHPHSAQYRGFYIDGDSYYTGGFTFEPVGSGCDGNRLDFAIDLMIKGPNDEDYTNHTVTTRISLGQKLAYAEETQPQKVYTND